MSSEVITDVLLITRLSLCPIVQQFDNVYLLELLIRLHVPILGQPVSTAGLAVYSQHG